MEILKSNLFEKLSKKPQNNKYIKNWITNESDYPKWCKKYYENYIEYLNNLSLKEDFNNWSKNNFDNEAFYWVKNQNLKQEEQADLFTYLRNKGTAPKEHYIENKEDIEIKQYWIGDPAYILSEDPWLEAIQDSERDEKGIKHYQNNRLIFRETFGGDGEFSYIIHFGKPLNKKPKTIAVDSGTIGIVEESLWKEDDLDIDKLSELGLVFECQRMPIMFYDYNETDSGLFEIRADEFSLDINTGDDDKTSIKVKESLIKLENIAKIKLKNFLNRNIINYLEANKNNYIEIGFKHFDDAAEVFHSIRDKRECNLSYNKKITETLNNLYNFSDINLNYSKIKTMNKDSEGIIRLIDCNLIK